MSDPIKHECGLALVRLRKPLDYYHAQYGTALWGLNKLYLLMSKQQNRGQDGAGIAGVKLDMPPGQPYIAHERVLQPMPPWQSLFRNINEKLEQKKLKHPGLTDDTALLKTHFAYCAELLMGHLRYATHGASDKVENLHPVVRTNNWKTRNVVLAGNFNLTNVDFFVQKLIDLGQHPLHGTDTTTMLERIGHFLDKANQELFDGYKAQGHDNIHISALIARELDVAQLMQRSAKYWDGGYTIGGLLGHGDLFMARDPRAIRPAFYYVGDEVVAGASERPALATAFNVPITEIVELPPAHVLTVKADGRILVQPFADPQPETRCSFERIYFSRGNDIDIYAERKQLGRLVTPAVLDSVKYDIEHTVFSYIPNTAFAAFLGMQEELDNYLNERKAETIASIHAKVSGEDAHRILSSRIRIEQVIHKDTNLRTFITNDQNRDDMAAHVYDITYGTVRPGKDNLVCLDDSIVRGTTLKQSILKILSRLKPRCIVIVSSAPQIRYPDCYGIDMSQIGRFIAFQAAVELHKERGTYNLIEAVYANCLTLKKADQLESENCVKAVYTPFTEQEISDKVAELLATPELDCDVKIVFQPVENLRKALPHHTGDWYFTGNYPTPGGNRVVNQAFMNYYEGTDARAY